jgi:hypothetical protein
VYVVIQQGGNGSLPSQIHAIGDINPENAEASNYSYQLFEATLSSTPFDQGDISSLNTFGLPAAFEVVFQNGTSQTRGYAPGLSGDAIHAALGNAQVFNPNSFPSADRLSIGPATANNAGPWPSSDWTAYVNALKANAAVLNDIQLVVPFTGNTPLQSAPMLSQYGVQYVAADQYGTDYFWLIPNTMHGATNTDWIRIPASQLMQNIYVQPGPLEVHIGGKDGPIQQQQSFTPNNAAGAVAKYFIAGFDAGYMGGSGTSPNPHDPTTVDLNHTWNWNFNYAYNATLNTSAIQYTNVLGTGPGTAGGNNRFYDPWAQYIQKNSNAYGYSYTDLVSEGGVNPQITLWDTGTNANVSTINISLYANNEILPSGSGYMPTPVPYVPPIGSTYAPALTQAAVANQLQFSFNFALGNLKFAPDERTPAFFKFYAPSDPTAGADGFVSVKIPENAAGFAGIWNYMQLSHSASGWSLTPTNKAGNPGFFDIINVPVTADGSPAWYQLIFGDSSHQTVYNIYAKSDPTTHTLPQCQSRQHSQRLQLRGRSWCQHPPSERLQLLSEFRPGWGNDLRYRDLQRARTIFGTSENDTLNGHGGHDTLNGGIGDDIITGGAGSDTAVSWQPSKSFLIKAVANDPRITVEDKVGADGTDHLFDVEYLRFSDQTLPLSWITNTANLGVDDILSIVDLYTAGLDRAPDAVGLAYWSSQLADGRNLADISKSFFATLEPTAMYGASLSTKHFVEKAYANALGRVPDAAGGAYWINEIETGNVGRSDFFAALIAGARSPTGSTTDAQYPRQQGSGWSVLWDHTGTYQR